MLSANENKDRFAKNSLVTGWNNWHGGNSKLQRHTGADSGSLKHNLHHHLVSVKAEHDNQLMIKAQVSSLKKQDMQRNRFGLDAVISSIKLLARQGMRYAAMVKKEIPPTSGKKSNLSPVSMRK